MAIFLPQPLFGDKMLIHTRDGSFTFYSLQYGESYKTKSLGAYTESRYKFFDTGGIAHKLSTGDVRLLDICLGIGMNLAVTLDKYAKNCCTHRLHIVSVEKDYSLIDLITNCSFLFPIEGYKILRQLLKTGRWENVTLELYITDARHFVETLSGKFDAIYFDPFSQKHNPEMWQQDVFIKMKELMGDKGALMTYASSAGLRNLLTEIKLKWRLIPSLAGRNHPNMIVETTKK